MAKVCSNYRVSIIVIISGIQMFRDIYLRKNNCCASVLHVICIQKSSYHHFTEFSDIQRLRKIAVEE